MYVNSKFLDEVSHSEIDPSMRFADALFMVVIGALICAASAAAVFSPSSVSTRMDTTAAATRIAFLGNSILYFNDVPRIFEALCGNKAVSDCCFRGGASLTSLLEKGNGMRNMFATPNAERSDGSHDTGAPTVPTLLSEPWDFVVMNDFTQGPARSESRAASIETLVDDYAPLLISSGAQPIILQTHAYRAHTKGSDDLGDTSAFTSRLREGCNAYAAALGAALPESVPPRVAPFGDACAAVKLEQPEIWQRLFHVDDFHLSPSGSYLLSLILYITVFGEAPARHRALPGDLTSLWHHARYMQPPDEPVQPIPSREIASYLLELAERMMMQRGLCRKRVMIY